MYKNLVIAGMLLMSPVVYGQQKPEPAKTAGDVAIEQAKASKAAAEGPKLKPDVELELVKSQKEVYELLLHMKNIEAQYAEIQKQFVAAQQRAIENAKTALKRSGIDDTKFELNPDTLAITVKPAAPADPPKK